MDRIEALGNQLSQITMYDIKSVYTQAKNMVLNVSEMEAKVREATNDDPWGASSTLMGEISQGTFNFQQFNEIMPCIYSRFMEKEAKQWREIYKALQLLEYLIKHGSERVVDDARSHIHAIKMLRNFHYIDDKGKDQGINVRNRAKELAEMLSDVEKIRTERKKAKANKSKYIGTGNDGMSFGSSGSRYGGFGSESAGYGGGYSGSYERDYNNHSSSSGGFRDQSSRRTYDEYDAGDYETNSRRSNSVSTQPPRTRAAGSTSQPAQPAKEEPKKQEKIVDLLGFDDDNDFGTTTSAAPVDKALPAVNTTNVLDDDDFDDFQSASAPAAALAPAQPSQPKQNVFEFLSSEATPTMQPSTLAHAPATAQRQPGANATLFAGLSPTSSTATMSTTQQPNALFTSTNSSRPSYMGHGSSFSQSGSAFGGMAPMNPTSPPANRTGFPSSATLGGNSSNQTGSNTAKSSSGGFDDLWNLSLGTSKPAAQTSTSATKSMRDLQKEKADAGIWGGSSSSGASGLGQFGSFAATSSTNASSAGPSGGDDLLL